jgi:hypothetical protein
VVDPVDATAPRWISVHFTSVVAIVALVSVASPYPAPVTSASTTRDSGEPSGLNVSPSAVPVASVTSTA